LKDERRFPKPVKTEQKREFCSDISNLRVKRRKIEGYGKGTVWGGKKGEGT